MYTAQAMMYTDYLPIFTNAHLLFTPNHQLSADANLSSIC